MCVTLSLGGSLLACMSIYGCPIDLFALALNYLTSYNFKVMAFLAGA